MISDKTLKEVALQHYYNNKQHLVNCPDCGATLEVIPHDIDIGWNDINPLTGKQDRQEIIVQQYTLKFIKHNY